MQNISREFNFADASNWKKNSEKKNHQKMMSSIWLSNLTRIYEHGK